MRRLVDCGEDSFPGVTQPVGLYVFADVKTPATAE